MYRVLCKLGALLAVALFASAAEASAPSLVRYLGQLRPDNLPRGVNFASNSESIDVLGNRAVVTAGNFFSGLDNGRAFLFDLSNPASPVQLAELRPSDNHAGNEFGISTAITDRYVFVGARGADNDSGAVYMYDISDPANITERKITAFDSAPYHYFGHSLAVSGNRLIVGAPFYSVNSPPAAAYVLDFSDPDNITQIKLNRTPGTIGGNFAEQVDISGNYALVGHISESSPFPFAGAAHLYDLSNPSNIRQRVLRPTDAPNYSAFGRTVAIEGNRALVGVSSDPGPDNPPGASDGAVWAFDLTNFNSIKQHEFGRPTDVFQSAPFGRGLELVGTTAAIGAFNDGVGGSVYLYDVANPLSPRQIERIAAPAGSAFFGGVLGFDGRTLLAADGNGRAHIYQIIPEPVSAWTAAVAFGSLAWRAVRRR
ncbi:MAG TPA: FG-GAP repeat protein [Lacipirellula sp.]